MTSYTISKFSRGLTILRPSPIWIMWVLWPNGGSSRSSMRISWSVPEKCGTNLPVVPSSTSRKDWGRSPRRLRNCKLIKKRKRRRKETLPGKTWHSNSEGRLKSAVWSKRKESRWCSKLRRKSPWRDPPNLLWRRAQIIKTLIKPPMNLIQTSSQQLKRGSTVAPRNLIWTNWKSSIGSLRTRLRRVRRGCSRKASAGIIENSRQASSSSKWRKERLGEVCTP